MHKPTGVFCWLMFYFVRFYVLRSHHFLRRLRNRRRNKEKCSEINWHSLTCLPWVPFVNCRQFMYLVISLSVLREGYGIWLYQFLIIAYLFTLLFFIKSCWYLGMKRPFYMWIYNFKSLEVRRVLVLQNLICSRIGLIMQNVFFSQCCLGVSNEKEW